MEPVTIGPCQLYLGDCREILPSLSGVDAVVTDPPYSSRTHTGARTFVATGKAAMKGFSDGDGSRLLVDFDAIDDAEFLRLVKVLLDSVSGWIVTTCDWRHAAAAEHAGLPLVRCGVWVKPDAAPQFTGDRPGTGWEAVAMFHRPGKKHWNGGGRHAVWTCGRDRSELHPSVKPLKLVAEWVRLFSNSGNTILDPFMGSGTTGVACVKEGRRFIGIEKSPEYFEIAVKRIREAVRADRDSLWPAFPKEEAVAC